MSGFGGEAAGLRGVGWVRYGTLTSCLYTFHDSPDGDNYSRNGQPAAKPRGYSPYPLGAHAAASAGPAAGLEPFEPLPLLRADSSASSAFRGALARETATTASGCGGGGADTGCVKDYGLADCVEVCDEERG